MKLGSISTIFSLCIAISVQAQHIRINQVGYFPRAQKIAIVEGAKNQSQFEICANKNVVYRGELSQQQAWDLSGETLQIADFSDFTQCGSYTIRVKGVEQSYPFTIAETVFYNVDNALAKAFYLNRAGIEIVPEYAGKYTRKAGHPDTAVIILPSAAGPQRKAGEVISTPKGWYDAGDYNKYVVNSGISTATLLLAYENYSAYFDTLTWNIPESANEQADLLDEIVWNLDWVLSMQDPADGGVYNKCTEAAFSGVVMPHEASNSPRYVVAKGTSAALNFAALTAFAARIFKEKNPEYAAQCLSAAQKAWQWAVQNPHVEYYNAKADGDFPNIRTGWYSDKDFSDEFLWAASELFIATHDTIYVPYINLNREFTIPWWQSVEAMALFSLYNHRAEIAQAIDTARVKEQLLFTANNLLVLQEQNPYRTPITDFPWGSNGVMANKGLWLLYGYGITHNVAYFNAALSCFDYLLGRNATGYSFVAGYGSKYSKNLHHRPSGADGIAGSIPGFVAGGPNGNSVKRDCGNHYSTYAAKAYYDGWCSFTTNEIAINWQAPAVYVAHALVAEYEKQKKIKKN
ncbi:MAG: glycoside hydrolase family 9 protein [Bacteroidales bacterium]|jgi:endoglucanase|nr:glycoside hydrolase family 9 protein [Bacteroidales bacterium]